MIETVRTLLREVLSGAVDETLIAWENQKYDPGKDPWIRETLLPGAPSKIELMVDGRSRTIGMYQLDVFSRSGDGVSVCDGIAQELVSAYSEGLALTDGDLTVYVRRSYPTVGNQAGDWYRVGVIVDWWVDN